MFGVDLKELSEREILLGEGRLVPEFIHKIFDHLNTCGNHSIHDSLLLYSILSTSLFDFFFYLHPSVVFFLFIGPSTDSIFKVSGSARKVAELKEQINSGVTIDYQLPSNTNNNNTSTSSSTSPPNPNTATNSTTGGNGSNNSIVLETDTHTVCQLLKVFLRELPEPLLTYSLYKGFQAINGTYLLYDGVITVEHIP